MHLKHKIVTNYTLIKIILKVQFMSIQLCYKIRNKLQWLKSLIPETCHLYLHSNFPILVATWWFSGGIRLQYRRCRFAPWVSKIPWRWKWQLTPVFLFENPMDRGAWQATVHGVTKSWAWPSTYTYKHIHTLKTRWVNNKRKARSQYKHEELNKRKIVFWSIFIS